MYFVLIYLLDSVLKDRILGRVGKGGSGLHIRVALFLLLGTLISVHSELIAALGTNGGIRRICSTTHHAFGQILPLHKTVERKNKTTKQNRFVRQKTHK